MGGEGGVGIGKVFMFLLICFTASAMYFNCLRPRHSYYARNRGKKKDKMVSMAQKILTITVGKKKYFFK